LKNLISFENVFKYQEYFPNNVKDLIDELRSQENFSSNERLDSLDLFGNKKKRNENFKNELFVYQTNLNNLNKSLNEKLIGFDYKLNVDIDKLQQNTLGETNYDGPYNYDNNFLLIRKELDKFRKEISIDLTDEDRKMIESYLTLKSIEKNLL